MVSDPQLFKNNKGALGFPTGNAETGPFLSPTLLFRTKDLTANCSHLREPAGT